ncbi:MAG: ATP-binding protein [Chloroflexi bacterium]|nr:ATP-binding protein [Chloroflexota bacterium]
MTSADLPPPDSNLRCPHCGSSVPFGQRYCPECGVDLLLAADLIFRQRLSEVLAPPPASPSSAEELVPRLGDALIHEGLLTPEQLERALAAQSEAAARGVPRRLGEVLLEQGLLSVGDLDRVVARQIAQLQRALQAANLTLEERVRERTGELTRAFERLSELNQLKANFVANISHELRTPLAHIVGYVELFCDQALGPLTPDQAKAMEVMQRASQRLQVLIEDLIQFAGVSQGAMSLQLSAAAPADLVQEAYEKMSAHAGPGAAAVEREIAEDLPPVRVDHQKIVWVLTQLLDNAVKFTRPPGRVTIRAARHTTFVRFEVTDTGIGIPQARLGEIFEPFHQLDGSANRRYAGTGLGLALARQIIEAHGAHLDVRSQEGVGSVFGFELPADAPGAGPSPEQAGQPAASRSTST